MENHLIVFVKNPIAGKVKTRIAKISGDDAALQIYHALLNHTKNIVSDFAGKCTIYYSDFVPENDLWDNSQFKKSVQHGNDLGERMQNAFAEKFSDSNQRIIIIGSDCAELSTEIIEDAFEKLSHHDVVIGPAEDGGYYLIGMKKLHGKIFTNKSWSSEVLLSETIAEIKSLELKYHLLAKLPDVDEWQDWIKAKQILGITE